MYAVGMLGSYLSQGVYAVAGPFQPFGGAVDILVVHQEDGAFKSSPWYVKFGDFQGVLKRQEKIVHISVNDVPADFHMILDSTGEAYFEKDVEPDEGACSMSPDGSSFLGGHEGDIEIVVGTDGGGNDLSHEDEGSSSTTSYSSRDSSVVGIAEVNIVTREEPCKIQQGQNCQANYESHIEQANARDANQVIIETRSPDITNATERSCDLDAPCTEDISNCKLTVRSQEEAWNAKDQVKVFTSTVVGETHNTDINDQDAVPDNDILFDDITRTVNTLFNLEQVSASTSLMDLYRVSDDSTTVKQERLPNNTTLFSVKESKSPKILTCTSDPDSCFSDDLLVAEKSEKSTFDDLEGDHTCNNSSSIGVGLDEGDKVTDCERTTIEAKGGNLRHSSGNSMNYNVSSDRREDNDSHSWDIESSRKQELVDDVVYVSQSNSPSTEEDSCTVDVDSGPFKQEESPDGDITGDTGSTATLSSVSSPPKWSFWPLFLSWSRIEKTSSLSNQTLLAAASVAIKPSFTEGFLQKHGYLKWQQKAKLRTYVPTSAQLASLNLKDGPNKVTFTFSSVIGKTQVDARIYLWKWNTKIVISDVDGTITKSDVLGQVMPLVGRDWSQCGVTRLFSAIKDNGYEVLFLSARAITQAYITRRFLLNLKQDGEALPEGPVIISPDGIFPSLYREVIRRAPHEFKISCLEGIRELFPKDVNPFYAGFGNRDTDEISYLKVGIPEGKIFIINPKGEVVVNHRVDCKSYTLLYALVDEMFPPMFLHEQEEFNEWNFWKVALPDIDDELSSISSKGGKKIGSSKK